jgi:hypothetical protein
MTINRLRTPPAKGCSTSNGAKEVGRARDVRLVAFAALKESARLARHPGLAVRYRTGWTEERT